MIKVLEGFRQRAARNILGTIAKRGAGGEWEYPPVVEAMEYAGLHPIGEYIRRRQTTISKRVDYRPIYELCTEAKRMLGTSKMVRWWDQGVVNEPKD